MESLVGNRTCLALPLLLFEVTASEQGTHFEPKGVRPWNEAGLRGCQSRDAGGVSTWGNLWEVETSTERKASGPGTAAAALL